MKAPRYLLALVGVLGSPATVAAQAWSDSTLARTGITTKAASAAYWAAERSTHRTHADSVLLAVVEMVGERAYHDGFMTLDSLTKPRIAEADAYGELQKAFAQEWEAKWQACATSVAKAAKEVAK